MGRETAVSLCGWFPLISLRILAVGDHKDKWVAEGCEHFIKMLSRFATIDMQPLRSLKNSPRLSPDEIKRAEAALFSPHLTKGLVVALSDSGTQYDSPAFARMIEKWQTSSKGTITFLIGGPYGLDPSILKRADIVLSLSKLTFSHQLVRLTLLEQLYRAFSILHGTDYHK